MNFTAAGLEGEYIVYRDRPLVRDNNRYVYGSNDEAHVLYLMVLTTKKVEKAEVPDAIIGQIISTDHTKPNSERMVKQFQANGLYEALDIGAVWLDKLNK